MQIKTSELPLHSCWGAYEKSRAGGEQQVLVKTGSDGARSPPTSLVGWEMGQPLWKTVKEFTR